MKFIICTQLKKTEVINPTFHPLTMAHC